MSDSGQTMLGVNLQTLVFQTTQVDPNLSSELGAEWVRVFPYIDGPYFPKWASQAPAQWRTIRKQYANRPTVACITHLAVSGTYGQNWTRDNWKEYVRRVISDPSSDGIKVWEIMNEAHSPNQKSGFLLNGDNTSSIEGGAQAYSLMVQDAFTIIKDYDKSNMVLAFGGLPSMLGSAIWQFNSDNWTAPNFMKFANEAWNYGMSRSCDGVSVHCYSDFNFLLDDYPTYWSQANQKYVESNKNVRQIWDGVLKTYWRTFGNRQIWITETGIPSNNPVSDHLPPTTNSPQKQAQFLSESFEFLSSKPFVKHISWWDLVDNPNPTGTGNFYWGWGLFDGATLTKKPVGDAFSRFVVNRRSRQL